MTPTDLIVAPATAPVGGGRAIVRFAGDGVEPILATLIDAGSSGWGMEGRPPRLVSGCLHPDGLGREWGSVSVTVTHWPGPMGPIGGPLAEVHLPGSPPLVAAFVAEACRLGARLARGGEFSLRSFLSGRLDLLQAEAVLAVVDARSPEELSAALDRMAGGVGTALERLRQHALDLVADVEAGIDFADEAAPDAVPVGVAWDDLARRIAMLETAAADIARVVAGRDTSAESLPRAVLVGRSNIGKSSLFNALVGRDAALVADEAGTTRDWIAAPLLGPDGQAACLLVDVAGVEDGRPDASEGLPATAAARARDEMARADVIVACRDACDSEADGPLVPGETVRAGLVRVITRIDRAAHPAVSGAVATSVVSRVGIDEAREAIVRLAATGAAERGPATLRMRAGITEARAALHMTRAAVDNARRGAGDEAVVAGCLHRAIDALGEVTGRDLGTDILDRIFSRHCIGK